MRGFKLHHYQNSRSFAAISAARRNKIALKRNGAGNHRLSGTYDSAQTKCGTCILATIVVYVKTTIVVYVKKGDTAMKCIKLLGFSVLLMAALGGVVAELRTPPLRVSCAECGDGPKDKKCPGGYKCVDAKCVKN